jgi:hypothetical protein
VTSEEWFAVAMGCVFGWYIGPWLRRWRRDAVMNDLYSKYRLNREKASMPEVFK